MSHFKVGLVGTGDIGRLHAQGLCQRPDVQLCVAQGTKPGGAQAFAEQFGAQVYPSWADLLRDSQVRAVDICVPNDLHRRYAIEAAEAGKHILCEKPIAMTLADGQAMIEAARKAGVLFMVAHPLRFWPEYVKMREILQSRELGTCHAVTMRRMLSLLLSVDGEQRWRHNPQRMGGAVIDLQIHDLDFLCWTFGMPEWVYCCGARSADGGLNHTYTSLTYPGGIVAMVESSYMLQGDPMVFSAKAVCDHGTLDYHLNLDDFTMHRIEGSHTENRESGRPATLIRYRSGEVDTVATQEPNVFDVVFAREVSYFVDCAQGKQTNTMTPPENALDALRVALTAEQSARENRPILIGDQ